MKFKKTKHGWQINPVCPECNSEMDHLIDLDFAKTSDGLAMPVLDRYELSCPNCGMDIDMLTDKFMIEQNQNKQ